MLVWFYIQILFQIRGSIVAYAQTHGQTKGESGAEDDDGSPRAIVFDGVEVVGVEVAVAVVVRDEVDFGCFGGVAGAGGEEAGGEEEAREDGGEVEVEGAPEVKAHWGFGSVLK